MGTKRVPKCKEETMRRWLFPAILALLLVGGITTAVAVGDGWDRHHDEVTRVVSANGDETIVIHDDHPPFFFPFGIFLFPLVFLFIFALMRAFFWPGRWGRGGPWGYGGGPGGGARAGWLEEWHQRAHAAGGDSKAGGTAETRSE
jgi:hypothetical protein